MLPFGGNESEEIHLLDYLKVIQKRMWLVVAFFVVIVSIVTIKTFKTTPVYQATARVVLEQSKVNVGFQQVVSESQFTPIDFYTNQCEIIKSRSSAKKVIDTLDLKNNPEFNPRIKEQNASQEKEQDPINETSFVNGFLSRLKVSLMRNSGVVNISYEGYDPQLITKVVNTVAKTYMEQDWERRYNVSKDALDWLNRQLRDVKIALEESERALQKYKKGADLITVEAMGKVDSGGDDKQNVVLQKLMELNAAVTEAKTDRVRLEVLYNKLNEFKNAKNKEEVVQSIPTVVQSGLIQNLKANYAMVEKDFAMYSQRYGMKHPKIVQLNNELNTLRDNIIKEVERICKSITTEYEVARSRESTLVGVLEQQKNEVFAMGDKAIQYGVLKREVDTNRQMYDTLLTRMKETNLTEDLKTSNIRVLDYAEVPTKPFKPKKGLNILLGIIVGLACGIGIAFVMEYMDNTIRTQEDVEKYLKTALLGIVGHIPTYEEKTDLNSNEGKLIPDSLSKYASKSVKNVQSRFWGMLGRSPVDRQERSGNELIAHTSPKHTITEAIKGIRTSIMFSHPDNPKRVILVTSTAPSEGKTLISANLTIVMAQTGKKVLIVDADLRKPSVHKIFHIDKSKGLSNLLVKTCDLHTVAVSTKVPNVHAIACGPIPPNPSELLSSPAMAEFLEKAKKEYDWIIIDSPPVMTVTDARILARVVDGIVFVIKSNQTTREGAKKAVSYFSDVSDKILGTVINDVDFSRDKYYYQYYYQYYYRYGSYGEKETEKAST